MARLSRGEGAAAFEPSAVRSVDLGAPLADLVAGQSSTRAPYRGAAVLATLHGEPLGFVELGLKDGRLSADELANGLWAALGARLGEHVRRHGCLPPAEARPEVLAKGIPPSDHSKPSGRGLPPVSVIVPTAGRPEALEKCLKSLRALRYPDFDVLVVDNRPADAATRRLVEGIRREDDRIQYLAELRPGSSVARNAGIAHARADLVAFTDDDVTVEPDWLDWLVAPMLRDPAVDVVTGLVLPAELETPAQRWFEDYGGFGQGFERREYDLGPHRADDRVLYPFWGGGFGSGNSMAFRKSALSAIGGFDPALGAGSPARSGADIEAFSHLILRGSRLVYEPRSICWHVHRRDEAALRRQLFAYGVGFTAILTKWLLRRPGPLLAALAQGLARAARGALAEDAPGVRRRPNLPRELDRLELRGYPLGPPMYLRSIVWSRRRRLGDVLPAKARP